MTSLTDHVPIKQKSTRSINIENDQPGLNKTGSGEFIPEEKSDNPHTTSELQGIEKEEEDTIEELKNTSKSRTDSWTPQTSPISSRRKSRFMENMEERSDLYRGSKDLEDGHSEKPRTSDAMAGVASGGGVGLTSAEREKQATEEPWYKARSKSTGKEDPFEGGEEGDVEYKTMKWWQATMIMIAETVSLGILSLPSVLATIGMVPGVILIAGLGILATYTGYVFWQFKMEYPWVHNMADVGEIIGGPIGREIGCAAQTIFLIFSMGSHILTFTIAMNTITNHATCTIVWGIIGMIVFLLFTIPRTMKKLSYFSIVSFISIFASVIITMIGVGVEPAPNDTVQATIEVSFAKAFLSVTNIIFAYAGHVAFFSFISELRDPKDFPKALYLLQFTDTTLYILVAIVVYRYAGPDVQSPALGSAGTVVRKVAYGIALPTIMIAGVIYGHVAAKLVYVRMFRGTKHMMRRTPLAIGSWLAIITLFWFIAWVIAESIPVFNDLLSLISSLFASWFTYGLAGILWLYMNKKDGRWRKKPLLTTLNVLLTLMGAAIMGMGLYASGTAIKADSSSGNSWSCADNSKGTK